MSHPDQNSLEQQRLRRLAKEYERKGYQVTMHPAPADLPPVLASCPIDLIAESDGKTIAVEVRTKETLTLDGSKNLRQMSDLVQQLPNWEFELVITNPRP